MFYISGRMKTNCFIIEKKQIIDSAIMKGSFMYEHFLTPNSYPNFQMIRKINSTLNLSHFALEQKVRIFLFSPPSSQLLCRVSICTQHDQYRYTVFYTEMTKPYQNKSHIKFNGILLIIILAACIHFKAFKWIKYFFKNLDV